MSKIVCPRCGCDTWKFGFHKGKDGVRHQKYRCKNPACRYQFAPDLPRRPKKIPRPECPICGSPMFIFKKLPDAIRLRCSNWRAKGKKRCTHKINIPIPPQKGFKISKDPIEDINISRLPIFHFNRMHYSKETISIALLLTIAAGIPAPVAKFILKELFRVSPHERTILRWTIKAAISFHLRLKDVSINEPTTWHTDETVIKKSKKTWLWLTKGKETRAILSWHLSGRRSTEHARNTFIRALERSKVIPEKIKFDGLWSYISALGDIPELASVKYHVCKDITADANNNLVERQFGYFKDITRRFRGHKSILGLWCFYTAQIYYYNFFRPQKNLDGMTPAEKGGAVLRRFHSRWKQMMYYVW